MKKEITVTENYLLILSDEEINQIIPNTYYLINGVLCLTELRLGEVVSRQLSGGGTMDICKSECKIITHHLPLNGAKPLDGVMLLPELEDHIVQLFGEVDSKIDFSEFCFTSFKFGYNKARENNNAIISKLIWLRDNSCNDFLGTGSNSKMAAEEEKEWNDVFQSVIDSLQQPRYPSHFEFEMLFRGNIGNKEWEEKTTTNHLGQTVAVGTYKFE